MIDEPYPYGVDHHPYFDPLVSGEAVRFTPSGAVVDYGWLSESDVDCYHGWVNDGYNPGGVAVDPNGGGVYATTETHLAVERLDPNLNNPAAYGGQPPSSEGNLPLPFTRRRRRSRQPPAERGVRLSLQSLCADQLECSRGREVHQPGPRVAVGMFAAPATRFDPAGDHSLSKFATKGSGKASVLIGCHVKLCVGTVSLKIASAVCKGCAASFPRHFRIHPGLQQTLSLG